MLEVLESLRASLSGRFELGQSAGAGGMGQVFEARGPGGQRVAVKRLTTGALADVQRFAREAEVLERLDHPRIVRYIEHGVTSAGEPYLVMEWVEGESLAERLQRGPLEFDEVIALGIGVAEALVAAHTEGLIHRDLKPSNLMLVAGRADQVKVIDFGIARAMGDGDGMTATGDIVGTPGFLAPEQARGARTLDGRADLFGLGCVLYQAVTGQPAFAAGDLMTMLALVLMHTPAPIADLRSTTPARLVDAIEHLLAKDPDARPPTAAHVIAELTAARDDPEPAAVRTRRRRRWKLARWLLGGAALAALAGGVVAWRASVAPEPLPPCSPLAPAGCRARCERGDGEACDVVGRNAATGQHGEPEDLDVALRYLRRACDLETWKACVSTATYLQVQARRTRSDATWADEAERRLRTACDAGLASACQHLASGILDHHFPGDAAAGHALLAKACQLGNKVACVMLAPPKPD